MLLSSTVIEPSTTVGLAGSAAVALGVGPVGTPRWPLWFVIVTSAESLYVAPATTDAVGTEILNG